MLVHYGIRLGWEIALFWVLSIASSIAMTGDSSPAFCLGMARLEIIGAVWITVRLLLAEDVFKTSGGWHTRPIPVWAPPTTQIILLACAFVLPWACRVALLRLHLGLDAAGCEMLLKRVWWPGLWTWLAFAAGVKLAAHFIQRGNDGMKAAAWSALAIIILVGTLKVCVRPMPGKHTYQRAGQTINPGALAQGIQQLLPDATDFIGTWSQRVSVQDKLPRAKLLLRVPLGGTGPLTNARLLSSEISLQGVRAAVRIQLKSIDENLLENLMDEPAVLRYADGTHATCRQHRRSRSGEFGPRPVVEYFEFFGSFVSPLCLPEYEGNPETLLAGAELMFFGEDTSGAPLEPTLERKYPQPYDNAKPTGLPPVGTPEDPDPLAASTYRLIDLLSVSWNHTLSLPDMEAQIQSLPAAALPFVLKRFPWSDTAWKKLVHPFLWQHAGAADIPALLDRLEFDQRLAVLFIEKGWTREAMPQLQRFAKDRLPLDPVCIGALAAERDPALAADLAAVALQLDRGLAELEAVLRNQPALDWPAFVKAGWRSLKYQKRDNRDCFYRFMLWAAQEGEFSAFRELAESLAGVTKWQFEQAGPPLQAIVAGEHPDLISYLRENIDRMTFDPATRKWTR